MQRRTKIRVTIIIILALGLGTVFLLQHSIVAQEFLAPRIEQALTERLQARVKIQGMDFGILSGVQIAQLSITPETFENGVHEQAAFVISQLSIRHAMIPLLAGRYQPAKVNIEHLNARVGAKEVEWISSLQDILNEKTTSPDVRVADGSLKLDLPGFDRPFEANSIRFFTWPQADGKQVQGLAAFNFGENSVNLAFDAAPANSRIDTRFTVHGFDFSVLPVLGNDEMPIDPAKLKTSGMLTGNLAIKFREKPNAWPDINGEATLSGLSGQYPGFPFSFENGFAKLSITENALVIRDGVINCAHGGIEVPAAGLRFEDHALACAWVRADMSGVQLPLIADKQVMAFMPVDLRPTFSSGTATGGLHVQWTPSEGLKYGVDMMLSGVSGSLPKLSTDFTALDASLSFYSPGRLIIRQARARVLGGRGEAAGSCRIAAGTIEDPNLEFWLNDVTETDTLVNLLPAMVRNFIDKAGFSNPEVDGLIALQPAHEKVDLSINANTAELPDLPIRLDEPHLNVKWTSDAERIVFENVQAKVGGSPLEGSGTLHFGQPMYLNFSLLGRYMPLRSRLLAWLGFDTNDWQVGGTYDIEMRANHWWPTGTGPAEFLGNMRIQVDLRDGALAHAWAGEIAENLSGHIALDSEGLNLSNMMGEICGIGLRGSGRLPLGSGSRATYFQAESENISLNSDLYSRLPFDIGLEELGLNGQCELKADLQGGGSSDSPFSANITAIMHHIEMMPGQTRISASGTARISASTQDWRQSEIEGAVSLDNISYGNLDGDRLSANFSYKDRQLAIPEMTIGAYAGKIRITDTKINTGDGSWQTTANLAHLDLESLVGAYGIEGRDAPSGVMRGDIHIAGQRLNAKTLTGQGTLKISRGRLYSFPLLVSVFNVLDLKLPRQSPVTDAYGDFNIEKGELTVKDLLFSGGSVPAHVEGNVQLGAGGGLKQKPISFIVTVAKQENILDQIPLINWAKRYTLDYLRNLVLQARVKGTFADHEVITLSSPLTDPIRKMFFLLEKFTPAPPGRN